MVAVKQLKDKSGTNIQPSVPDKVGYASTTETTLSWGTPNTITEDGWVKIFGNSNDNTSINLVINEVNVCWWLIGGLNTLVMGIQYPVKKDDIVKALGGVSGTSSNKIYFYPNRTALGGGV